MISRIFYLFFYISMLSVGYCADETKSRCETLVPFSNKAYLPLGEPSSDEDNSHKGELPATKKFANPIFFGLPAPRPENREDSDSSDAGTDASDDCCCKFLFSFFDRLFFWENHNVNPYTQFLKKRN